MAVSTALVSLWVAQDANTSATKSDILIHLKKWKAGSRSSGRADPRPETYPCSHSEKGLTTSQFGLPAPFANRSRHLSCSTHVATWAGPGISGLVCCAKAVSPTKRHTSVTITAGSPFRMAKLSSSPRILKPLIRHGHEVNPEIAARPTFQPLASSSRVASSAYRRRASSCAAASASALGTCAAGARCRRR
jgi:hypothetical protein